MSFSLISKEIPVGPYTFYLTMRDKTPIVKCDSHDFVHLWLLVHQYPILSNSTYLKEFAKISNFFWKGLNFQFIDFIPSYQEHYLSQIELEKHYTIDIFPYRLTDYKIFDVSCMCDPYIENEQLFYFVYDTTTGVPYRVVCPFPYIPTSNLVHYQILPLKDPF